MTALSTPNQVYSEATFDVYVKAVNDTPPEAGQLDAAGKGEGGWVRADNLRFGETRLGAWPQSGTAAFDRIGLNGVVEPFEYGDFENGPDDQVRVVMQPANAGSSLGPDISALGGEDSGIVIFEGTLQRSTWGFRGATQDADEYEQYSLVATDAPSIDNQSLEHLIVGRFVAADDTPTPVLVDGPSVACVFNANDRPNRRPEGTVVGDPGGLVLSCSLFSADDAPTADYWTLREALKHLIVCWLYGIDLAHLGDAQGDLTRSATLEPQTHEAIFGDGAAGDRWAGLDKVLTETDVQGLGVFDAIDRVCRAGGYRCAVLPPMGRKLDGGLAVDRQYLLRVWRAGAGPESQLRLEARELVNADASVEERIRNNNVNRLSGIRDTSRIRNHIIATGRTLIETTVELKPLWHPGDMDDLGGAAISLRQAAMPIDQAGDTYHQKHVAKGSQFEAYGHVGRLWGLDETGDFVASDLGYESGDYAHTAGGFDWLDHLGIDGDDDLSAARVANGVTAPIRWTKHRRRPLRLTRYTSVAIGQAHKLEVSEDSGETWYALPASAYAVLTEGYFGVRLLAANLAAVNRLSFGEAGKFAAAEPEASWWSLLASGTSLRFRLTCLIEADHAARYDAPIDAGAFSRTPRAMRLDTSVVEVWQSPSSGLGDGSWARIDDGGIVASAAGPDRTPTLRDLAERTRDERGQMRYAMSCEHWLMDPTLFAIGDVITGIAGRAVDLGQYSAGSGTARYPSVIGMRLTGYPAQNITFDIGDEAARRGV